MLGQYQSKEFSIRDKIHHLAQSAGRSIHEFHGNIANALNPCGAVGHKNCFPSMIFNPSEFRRCAISINADLLYNKKRTCS
jgi:hypothetical protein